MKTQNRRYKEFPSLAARNALGIDVPRKDSVSFECCAVDVVSERCADDYCCDEICLYDLR